jgi:hypothetical protein
MKCYAAADPIKDGLPVFACSHSMRPSGRKSARHRRTHRAEQGEPAPHQQRAPRSGQHHGQGHDKCLHEEGQHDVASRLVATSVFKVGLALALLTLVRSISYCQKECLDSKWLEQMQVL